VVDVQRYFLKPGKYTMEISLKDNHATNAETFRFNEEIEVKYERGTINLSDIELVDYFKKTEKNSVLSKSGYDLIPYSINFYPEKSSKLAFYNEAYGTDSVQR